MSVALGDPHGMFLDALADALGDRGHDIAGTATDPGRLRAVVAEHATTVCVVGLGSRDAQWLEAVAAVKQDRPGVAVVLLGGAASAQAWLAYDTGAVEALVDKRCDIATVDKVLQRVEAGERLVEGCSRPTPALSARSPLDQLTEREREVLRLIVAGLSTQRMAAVLGVSANTVRTHVQHVLAKLGVDRRSKAIKVATDLGMAEQAWAR